MNMRLVRFTKGLGHHVYVGMAITAQFRLFFFHYVGMYREIQDLLRGSVCALHGVRGAGSFAGAEFGGCLQLCWAVNAFVMEKCGILKTNGEMQLSHSRSVCSPPFVAFTPATAVIIIVFSIAGLSVLCFVWYLNRRTGYMLGKMT